MELNYEEGLPLAVYEVDAKEPLCASEQMEQELRKLLTVEERHILGSPPPSSVLVNSLVEAPQPGPSSVSPVVEKPQLVQPVIPERAQSVGTVRPDIELLTTWEQEGANPASFRYPGGVTAS